MVVDAISRRGYLVAGSFGLLFVASRFFHPGFFDNEWVYALGPMRMAHPGFLDADPYLAQTGSTFLVHDLLFAPLYYLFAAFPATALARILIWIFQLFALARLARTLGLAPWSFVLLLLMWVNVEQTLVAGEWIFGCASGKPVAYGFVFLALEAALKGQVRKAGVFSGLAGSFHLLVGGWSAMALAVALLVTRRGPDRARQTLSFCLFTALLSLPGLVPALIAVLGGAGADLGESARIAVVQMNPFHQDPAYFISGLEHLKLAVWAVLTLWMLYRLFPGIHGAILLAYSAGLGAFFLAGVAARQLEAYRFLNLYPFRVADGWFPLAFWLGVAALLQRGMTPGWRRKVLGALAAALMIGAANWLVDLCEPRPQYGLGFRPALTALSRTEPRLTAYWLREQIREWRAAGTVRSDDSAPMYRWIGENTPEDSVIVTPPWDFALPLRAGRAQFVSFKITPEVGKTTIDWMARMEALNRGGFRGVGAEMLDELRENYPALTEAEIRAIERDFGADYFLTDATRPLDFDLVHQSGPWRLYRL